MPDESGARRPGFVAGVEVRLADGQAWWLPGVGGEPAAAGDPLDALLAALAEAEDVPERLRAGLALSIHLLTRNYELPPADLGALLSFAPDDPAAGSLRSAVEGWAIEALSRRRPPSRATPAGRGVPRVRWFHRLWPRRRRPSS